MKVTMIAAITLDGALGKGGDMIYHIPADLRRFKQLTMGHPLVMGRRTYESFPNGPLPGRRNLVVTRQADYAPRLADGALAQIEVYPSLESALAACEGEEPMVLGGGQIYAQAMPLANRLIITEIDATAPDADTHFPAIDLAQWAPAQASDWLTDPRTQTRYRYIDYERRGEEAQKRPLGAK